MLKHIYILLILNFPQNMQAVIFSLSVTSLHPFPFTCSTVSKQQYHFWNSVMDKNSNEMGLAAYNVEPEYSEEMTQSTTFNRRSFISFQCLTVCPRYDRNAIFVKIFDFRKNKLSVQLKELLKLINTTHIFFR